jgi:hypothetical protein
LENPPREPSKVLEVVKEDRKRRDIKTIKDDITNRVFAIPPKRRRSTPVSSLPP